MVEMAHLLAVLLSGGEALDGLELIPEVCLGMVLRVGLIELFVCEVEVDLALGPGVVGSALAFLSDLVDDGAAESAGRT